MSVTHQAFQIDLHPARGSWWAGLYLRKRLYYAWGTTILITALGVIATPFMYVGLALAVLVLATAAIEYLVVSRLQTKIWAGRRVDTRLSLADDNPVSIRIDNRAKFALHMRLLDELPVQLQERDFGFEFNLSAASERVVRYNVKPYSRGNYEFGEVLLFVCTQVGLVERRFRFGELTTTAGVYPSIVQMKQQALRVRQLLRRGGGNQRQRQFGRSYEFDQIKNYVAGDDYRQLNWKATARANDLMLNTFVEERSQQIVAILDTGRTMLSPFDGLSLLDYSINSTLALLNVALQRGDRVGLIGFDKQIHTNVPLTARPQHLQRIMQVLYAQTPTDFEPDYGALYQYVRRTVKGRSLLMLYTSFDTMISLQRNLPMLAQLARMHLLVMVNFVNDAVAQEVERSPDSLDEAYLNTIALEYEANQTRIAATLARIGVVLIRTRPQDLTAQAVTNYLAVKGGGRL